ncbi:MAG: 2-C-methyl-D-erythritol 2,4-cyclodiphosphate synthase [Candidatus Aminicenantes bacterium]|nr:2-C-methyl-D-erythritol 2,4-cyclodiphosphate synthase [Candidatus Aminicenantes bacterium]
MLKIRSGIGYDIHKVKKGSRGLYIGGVKVADEIEFIAHSDGDVLIHALIDSLFGAIGEKDIGEYFPDNDDTYKNIKSEILLGKCIEILRQKHFEILNIDCVIIAELPKISPFKDKIKEKISAVLAIPQEDFNLKAKTKEQLETNMVGRGEAIECYCISLLRYSS